MSDDDDFDPVEFIRTRRSQDEAWAALQRPLARVYAEPAMLMLAGKDAKHLHGYDLTRKLATPPEPTLAGAKLGEFSISRQEFYKALREGRVTFGQEDLR